ncbi:hypothetical protein GCM10027048_20260 [Hymenobacter coalescens]
MRRVYFVTAAVDFAYEAETTAFLTAAGLPQASTYFAGTAYEYSGTALWNALNNYVLGTKAAGIWAKLPAIYPVVGGTAQAHRLNLKDPRVAVDAFALDFYGGPIHGPLGISWDGATQYADTHFVAADHLTNASGLMYASQGTGGGAGLDYYDIGAYNAPGGQLYLSTKSYFQGNPYAMTLDGNIGDISAPFPNSGKGLYQVSQYTEGQTRNKRLVRNAEVLAALDATAEDPQNFRPTASVFLGALNVNGGPYGYSPRGCSFAAMAGAYLNQTELLQHHQLVQDLHTALNRPLG